MKDFNDFVNRFAKTDGSDFKEFCGSLPDAIRNDENPLVELIDRRTLYILSKYHEWLTTQIES